MKHISAFSFPPTATWVSAEEGNVERVTDRRTSERLARGLVSLPSWMHAAQEKTPSERTPAAANACMCGTHMSSIRGHACHRGDKLWQSEHRSSLLCLDSNQSQSPKPEKRRFSVCHLSLRMIFCWKLLLMCCWDQNWAVTNQNEGQSFSWWAWPDNRSINLLISHIFTRTEPAVITWDYLKNMIWLCLSVYSSPLLLFWIISETNLFDHITPGLKKTQFLTFSDILQTKKLINNLILI